MVNSKVVVTKNNKNEKDKIKYFIRRKPANKKKIPPQPIQVYKNEQKEKLSKVKESSRKSKFNKKLELEALELSVGESDYLLLKNSFALKATDENKKRYPDHSEKLGYIIIDSEAGEKPIDALGVTVNKDSGSRGIMTGIITVKFEDLSLHTQLFSSQDYTVINIYEHINLVHYQFDSIEQVVLSFSEIQGNSNVRRSSLEILEYVRRHR